MRTVRPIPFIIIAMLAIALPQGASVAVSAETGCVLPLSSVTVEGRWNSDCPSRSRENAYARFYTFSLLRQSEVSITLESETDPYVFLLSGSGVTADYLAENDDIALHRQDMNSQIEMNLLPGEYTIEATTYEQNAIGDFTLTVKGVGPLDDRAALVALYHATDGDNWARNDNWLTDAPLGEWHGVNADFNGRVTHLSLQQENLVGRIPTELGVMDELRQAYFSGNQLTGCIPYALRAIEDNDFAELDLPFCTEPKLAFDECAHEISSIPYQYHSIGVEGVWSMDCVSTNRPGSYVQFYTLTLRHPFEITIALTSEHDTYLYLMGGIGANGIALGENDDYESTNSRIQAPLQPGNYTIEANTHDAGASGSFSLKIEVDVWGPTPLPTALTDRAALTALYHSANGEDWHASANWLTDASLSDWHGVETDDSGRVTWLELDANNLSGELPLEFGNLDQLEWVNIRHNQLTGELSRSLTNLTILEHFYFDNNAGLCAPDYDAFQEWSQTLEDFRGDACAPLPPNDERDALIALYHATRGDNWRNHVGWLTGAPLGEWHGVTTDSNGSVIELNIFNNNLNGHIPPELSNLTDLTELQLPHNRLSGEIPAELGSLTNLAFLGLDGNDLSGEIPAELGNLNDLKRLTINHNELTGEIPTELGNLTRLETLGLWGNNLSGEIPAELGDITNLKHLNLSGNELTGEIPAELGDLIALDELMLNYNQFTGHIPAELGNLTELRTLNISHNQLVGGIPPELRNLTNLIEMDIHTNRLEGKIPSELGALSNLKRINLADNNLTGEIPPELGTLSNLERIDFSGNNLTGEIPPELADIETLTRLYLWDNDLTAEAFLPRLSKMTALERLRLSGNQIDGVDVLPQVAALPNLIYLGLRDSRLDTDDLLPHLDSLDGLEYLILSDNLLTGGQLLPMLAEFDSLRLLDIQNNQLTGEIPSEIGNLPKLRSLFLNGNQLTGDIPSELSNLSNLGYLHLDDNRLTGELPVELGNLSSLIHLRLNDNRLTGALPQALTQLEYLNQITFHNNAGLCAPADAAFQEWLQSIDDVQGATCETPI